PVVAWSSRQSERISATKGPTGTGPTAPSPLPRESSLVSRNQVSAASIVSISSSAARAASRWRASSSSSVTSKRHAIAPRWTLIQGPRPGGLPRRISESPGLVVTRGSLIAGSAPSPSLGGRADRLERDAGARAQPVERALGLAVELELRAVGVLALRRA